MLFNIINFIIIISKILSITYPITFKPDSYILQNSGNTSQQPLINKGFFNIKAKQNGTDILLTPSFYFPLIMFFSDTPITNKPINNTVYNQNISQETYEYHIYESKFILLNHSEILLKYGHTNKSIPSQYKNQNSNGILGLSPMKKIKEKDNENSFFSYDLYQSLFPSKEKRYIIIEPHYNDNCNITNSSIFLGDGNNTNFEHGFEIVKENEEDERWSLKLIALFFENDKNEVSRDGKRINANESTIYFDEGDQRYMILSYSYAEEIMEKYFNNNCKIEKDIEDNKYYHIVCNFTNFTNCTDLYIQFEDYGYKVSKTIIWEEKENKQILKIHFTNSSNELYIFSGILGNFRRKYSKENEKSTKIYIERGYCDSDIVDLSGIFKIIVIIIVLFVVIVITIFVMRMMKKDTNDSVDYNNMQQI